MIGAGAISLQVTRGLGTQASCGWHFEEAQPSAPVMTSAALIIVISARDNDSSVILFRFNKAMFSERTTKRAYHLDIGRARVQLVQKTMTIRSWSDRSFGVIGPWSDQWRTSSIPITQFRFGDNRCINRMTWKAVHEYP